LTVARRLAPVWRLSRFQEYVAFVVITTLLGAAAAHGSFGWPLIAFLVANWLAVGFAFMVNDVEDASDDALTPAKARRNPVSSGDLPAGRARLLSFATAGAAVLLYASLGWVPFIAGSACVVLSYFYSARPLRLKSAPIADLASHALILAGLQFATAYALFEGGTLLQWLSPLVIVLSISLYGQLFNQLRDFDGDRLAGLNHTASLLGRRWAYLVMMAWLALGLAFAGVLVVVVQLFPIWVLLLALALATVLSGPRLASVRASGSPLDPHRALQKPVEIAVAVALAAWFAGPWALATFV
jgi:4-hydroxybenzoate polyprenyltransferase